MARGEIPFAVSKATGAVSGATATYAVIGASVQVNVRGGSAATVYAGETGATTLSNPLTTTSEGRIDGWLDEGSYDLVISGSGITTFTQPHEVVRGDGVGRIAANAVNTAAIAAGAVTFAKLAADVATNLIPPGTIFAYAGSTLPTGWLWCDGKLYNGTTGTYLALWNAIGLAYGGTAQASFAVPDGRGRTLVGADSLGTNGAASRLSANNTRGVGSGTESHSLTTAQMPSHNHAITDPGHVHTSPGSHAVDGGFGTPAYATNTSNATTTNAATTGITIQNAGSGTAHNNMQPYLVCNMIVKL